MGTLFSDRTVVGGVRERLSVSAITVYIQYLQQQKSTDLLIVIVFLNCMIISITV
jgi:hypothetical protein